MMEKLSNVYEQVELLECPCCGGAGFLEEENGWCWYVMCIDCGAQTTHFEYRDETEKLSAAQAAADIWNKGKVVSPARGE